MRKFFSKKVLINTIIQVLGGVSLTLALIAGYNAWPYLIPWCIACAAVMAVLGTFIRHGPLVQGGMLGGDPTKSCDTQNISPVDISKSMLLFSPTGNIVGDFIDGTTIRFETIDGQKGIPGVSYFVISWP